MIGYLRTIRNYLNTAKGKHDFVDYVRAGFFVLVTTLIVDFILRLV